MAVEKIGLTTGENVKEFRVLSTDEKPTEDVGSGSICREIDTKKVWEYSAANVNPITSDGWWEV